MLLTNAKSPARYHRHYCDLTEILLDKHASCDFGVVPRLIKAVNLCELFSRVRGFEALFILLFFCISLIEKMKNAMGKTESNGYQSRFLAISDSTERCLQVTQTIVVSPENDL